MDRIANHSSAAHGATIPSPGGASVTVRCGLGALFLALWACVALVIAMVGAATESPGAAYRGPAAADHAPASPSVEAMVESGSASESEDGDGVARGAPAPALASPSVVTILDVRRQAAVDPRARWISVGLGRGPPL